VTSTTTRDRLIAGVAIVMYLAVGVVPYSGSTLVVPFGAAIVLWVTWLAGFVGLVRFVAARSPWSLAAAPIALAIWVGYVSLGSWLFGWTA
jgi:hypothetical protein